MTSCPFTLSARRRRGELDQADQRRLEMALSASVESQLLHEAGCGFDAEDSWMPGDDTAAERVARAVLARAGRPRPRRRGWVMALLGAVGLVAISTGTAAAMYGSWKVWVRTTPATLVVTEAGKPTSKGPAQVRSGKPPAPGSAMATASPAQNVENVERLEEVRAPAPPVAASSASQLFADAARARQKGQIERAIALYDTLQGRFPSTAEARASDIALGMLHLGRGNPGPASAHFRRYLRQSPHADLASEALYGQARAFEALGRATEARQSWAELLRSYPDSAYADVARSKIGSSP
jgi:hypothetical protein